MKTAVGIYKGEVFIAEDGNVNNGFGVIRPVSAEMLEQLHDISYWMENYRDWWADAARAGRTDDSLEEYFDKLMEEEDNGDEEFIGKDSSDCDVFDYNPGLRKRVDAYIKRTMKIEVGTWECAGYYTPHKDKLDKDGNRDGVIYQRFDKVLDNELAQKWYDLRNLGKV